MFSRDGKLNGNSILESKKKAEKFLFGIVDSINELIQSNDKNKFIEKTKESEIPLCIEAHTYLCNKYNNLKPGYSKQIRELWQQWNTMNIKDIYIEERSKMRNAFMIQPYYADSGVFFPYNEIYVGEEIYYEELADDVCILVQGPDFVGSELECFVAMLRAKETLGVLGFRDDFKTVFDYIKSKIINYSIGAESLNRNQWMIFRDLTVHDKMKQYIKGSTFMVMEAMQENDFKIYNDIKLKIYEFSAWITGVLFLLFSGAKDEYLDFARKSIEKMAEQLDNNGSIANDILITCAFLFAVHFSGIDPYMVIQNEALVWLISQQNENGSWTHYNTEEWKIKDWNVLSTVIVLETIDLITNTKPLPIWATGDIKEEKITKVVEPFPTPEGIKWEDVVIRFIDDEEVQIRAGSVSRVKNFVQMGFEFRQAEKPDKIWKTLREFAEHDGIITWDDEVIEKKEIEAHKRRISALRKRLKSYFQLDEEPIPPYSVSNSYKTRFRISIFRK